MGALEPANIRNIALTGQSGSGKTTLAERLLFASGGLTRMGSVEDGSTVSDWTDEEKSHKHSLSPSVLHFEHEGHYVNIIDTPGLADFTGHAIASFPAVETVAVVLDAHKGIGSVTRRLMAVAAERKLPRLVIINGIDEENADVAALTLQIRETFGAVCLPINLPGPDRGSVINVFESESGGETLFSSVEEAHTQIIEQVVETDDDLMNEYLEKGAEGLDHTKVHDAFELALREGHLVPICYCSAKTGAGTDDLLHIMASLLPSPPEGNPRPFVRTDDEGNKEEFFPEPDAGKPLIAHVFKVQADPFVGKLGMFRVHQGTMKPKSELYIDDIKKAVRITHLFKRQGKEQVEVDEVGPGDIGAVAKIEEIKFDTVIHDHAGDAGLSLKPLPLPKPMFGLAISLKSHKDETKFAPATHKMMEEDPCFVVERIEATKQTVMRGLGEMHLRIALEKLKEQYGIELETAPPRVAYKETITSNADGHHRHKKQSGGAGEFGEVYLRVEPLPEGSDNGFEFENKTVGGSIPRQFMPAIEKGIRQVLAEGAIAGYPMQGVRVEVYDGKHHAVDSKEVAFIKAGKVAFVDAVKKAQPVLLEPYVDLEITVPSGMMGDIAGDLSTKRGRVKDTKMIGSDTCVIEATAPLGEVQNYSNELKSITGGAGSFSMDYSHDERTPPHVQQEVIAAFKPGHEED